MIIPTSPKDNRREKGELGRVVSESLIRDHSGALVNPFFPGMYVFEEVGGYISINHHYSPYARINREIELDSDWSYLAEVTDANPVKETLRPRPAFFHTLTSTRLT